MSQTALSLRHPDEDLINNIPRHPADPTMAYGENLDRAYVTGLIKDRVLSGAIFPRAVSSLEIARHVSPELQRAYRQACGHFTYFFYNQRPGFESSLTRGVAVMRGSGMRSQGFDVDTPGVYEGRESLMDFLPDNWLINKIVNHGELVATPMGYGYHVFQAFPGMAGQGFVAEWHDHLDISSHTTLEGAPLEWLPQYVGVEDAKRNPTKYEHLVQRLNVGDLIVMGRVIHRSSHLIPEQGQFAFTTHGPLPGNGD